MVELEQDAIIGLAVGFGSIAGAIVLCCVLWNCCCGSKDNEKSKKKPVGPWMEMCNNSNSSASDAGSTKTVQTPVSRRSRDSDSPKYDNRSQQRPLRAPYKHSTIREDLYPDRASPEYNNHYHDMPTENYGQPTRPAYKQTRMPDMELPAVGSSYNRHSNERHYQASSSSPSNWQNVSEQEQTNRAIHNVKKNPEAFYQRYLY